MQLAPIAIFVYNRPNHTRKVIESLQKNLEARHSNLYVFSDGWKNSESKSAVIQVREYIKVLEGFQSITIIERDKNWGLANSIIDGVTKLCDEYGKVIVIEDDLVVSPFFLDFMNNSLDVYEDELSVGSISAYKHPVKQNLNDEIFFSHVAWPWGWATWKRAWIKFEVDGSKILDMLIEANQLKSFDKLGVSSNKKMLKRQINRLNDSWFIRWQGSLYLNDFLILSPFKSLVINIGNDGSGIHCANLLIDPFDVDLYLNKINVPRLSIDIQNPNFIFLRIKAKIIFIAARIIKNFRQ